MTEHSSAASADEIGDFGTYNNFRDHIGEKFCAVVNGVNGVISCACGDLRIEREHNGSVTLSKRAAKLLTGALQQPGIPAQCAPDADLVQRCKELLEWSSTGLLNGGKGGSVRALASKLEAKIGPHYALSVAETQTKDDAMRELVRISALASPPCGGPDA